jgi:hypothetical protein
VKLRGAVQQQEVRRANAREQGIVRGSLTLFTRQPKVVGLLAGSRFDAVVRHEHFHRGMKLADTLNQASQSLGPIKGANDSSHLRKVRSSHGEVLREREKEGRVFL